MTRLSWQDYFFEITKLVAQRSPCHRLQVGCVLVKDNRIVATGQNGFLPGAPHTSIVVDNHEQATVHAEQNCIADCAKRGVQTEGACAQITHTPCVNCFKILVASGVKEILQLSEQRLDPVVLQLAEATAVRLQKIEDGEPLRGT